MAGWSKLLAGLLVVLLAGCGARLVTLNNADHFSSGGYNENLRGLGVEVPTGDTTYLGLTFYTNSHDKKSRLLSLAKESRLYKNLYWGPVVGIADGYDDYLFLGGFQMRYELFEGISIRGLFTPIVAVSGLVIEFN